MSKLVYLLDAFRIPVKVWPARVCIFGSSRLACFTRKLLMLVRSLPNISEPHRSKLLGEDRVIRGASGLATAGQ